MGASGGAYSKFTETSPKPWLKRQTISSPAATGMAGTNEPVRIAFLSCQDFISGYYVAHRDLLAQDVDLVVSLGDQTQLNGGASQCLGSAVARQGFPGRVHDEVLLIAAAVAGAAALTGAAPSGGA